MLEKCASIFCSSYPHPTQLGAYLVGIRPSFPPPLAECALLECSPSFNVLPPQFSEICAIQHNIGTRLASSPDLQAVPITLPVNQVMLLLPPFLCHGCLLPPHTKNGHCFQTQYCQPLELMPKTHPQMLLHLQILHSTASFLGQW